MGDERERADVVMTETGFDERVLNDALVRAVRAPSVHNSQPWRWRVGPHGVDLYTDATRRLPRTDPDGRDQVMSCGAALHHLLVALADAGQGARVRRIPDPARPLPPRDGRAGAARRRRRRRRARRRDRPPPHRPPPVPGLAGAARADRGAGRDRRPVRRRARGGHRPAHPPPAVPGDRGGGPHPGRRSRLRRRAGRLERSCPGRARRRAGRPRPDARWGPGADADARLRRRGGPRARDRRARVRRPAAAVHRHRHAAVSGCASAR